MRLPQVLGRVRLGAVGWQEEQPHVLGHDQLAGQVPAGLVHDHEGKFLVVALRLFGQDQRHRLRVDQGQHEACRAQAEATLVLEHQPHTVALLKLARDLLAYRVAQSF